MAHYAWWIALELRPTQCYGRKPALTFTFISFYAPVEFLPITYILYVYVMVYAVGLKPFPGSQVWQLSCRHLSMCDHMTEGRDSHGTYRAVTEINRRFPKQANASDQMCECVCVWCPVQQTTKLAKLLTGAPRARESSLLLQLLLLLLRSSKLYGNNPNFPRFCPAIKIIK